MGRKNKGLRKTLSATVTLDHIRKLYANHSTGGTILPCSFCGKKEDVLGVQPSSYCGRCGYGPYCSRECQVAHWNTHKEGCRMSMNLEKVDQSVFKLRKKICRFDDMYSPILINVCVYEVEALLVSMGEKKVTPNLWEQIAKTHAIYVQLEDNVEAYKPGFVLAEIQIREFKGDRGAEIMRAKLDVKSNDLPSKYIPMTTMTSVKGHIDVLGSQYLFLIEKTMKPRRLNRIEYLRATSKAYQDILNDMILGKKPEFLAAARQAYRHTPHNLITG